MAEKKLLGEGSLHKNIENLLSVESKKQYNDKIISLLLDLRSYSKDRTNITTMELYNALDNFNINIEYSPHDEFLAINDQGIITIIKPKLLTTETQKQGWKIISQSVANNLEQILQGGQEKTKTQQEDYERKQEKYIKELLRAIQYIDESNVHNKKIYNYIWENKVALIKDGVIFTVPHKNKSLIRSYAFDKKQVTRSVDRINYDVYIQGHGRMIGFGPKNLHSVNDFYMFSKRSLKNDLEKKLQILLQKQQSK